MTNQFTILGRNMASSILAVTQDSKGVLVVDSRLIAEDLGIEHKNFLATVGNYLVEIEDAFGAVAFETREFKTTQGNKSLERFAFLTEDQATFVMTLSRNSEKVVRCKVGLVQAFSRAKEALASQPKTQLTVLQNAINQLVAQEERVAKLEASEQVTQQRLAAVEAEQDRYQAPSGRMFTVTGYASILKLRVSLKESGSLGKRASALCRQRGVTMDSVYDPRWGDVKTYPQEVLAELMGELP